MEIRKFKVSGMTCGGCVKSIEQALKSHPNVKSLTVSLAEHMMQVETALSDAEVIGLLEDLGFEGEAL